MPSKSKSIMVSDVSSSSGGSRLSRTNGPTFVVTFGGNKNQGISSRLGGGAHRPQQQQQRVTRVVNERIPITSRLGVRGGGGSRRPVFVYEDDDDLEEIVYEEAQPSVFDRVSAVRRF
ncbi:hypothetical protein L596_027891 [Steinernema carpocapsae]|uniref:Uncharacterized protein n=1 Tax=Steinernema carpocapsae TaxID=34508 RepID=A0A4U5LWV2_STECR|nr:hypothetical protein L596_027891 [Steinernema carpocapsae]